MGTAEIQGRLWGVGARDWSQLNEVSMQPMYEAVFDATSAGAGTRLLDAGCGSGLALQLAGTRGATLTGLDASEGLLMVARERVPEADLRVGELEELPYADDSFDVVTAFNSAQYAADPVAALREMRRVARPGGHVVVVTWGRPEQCETRSVLVAIGGLLPPPPPGAGGPFALSAPGKLAELAEAAGLTPVRTTDVPVSFIYADVETAVRAQMATGPARRAIEHAGADATRAALRGAFVDSGQSDGTIRQENVFQYLITTA